MPRLIAKLRRAVALGSLISALLAAVPQQAAASQGSGATRLVLASYGYQGRDLLVERNVGGLTGHMAFDGARRLTSTSYRDPAAVMAFGENLGWNKRNQLTSQMRGDLNDAGKLYQYDAAGRITAALAHHGEPPADPTGLDGEHFRYDTADNLVERSKKTLGLEETTPLPPDESGRNRPTSLHGIPLTWDANGNLTDKGDLHFEYDYRNRLSRVTRQGHEVATYGYDAFNRRVEKSVEGITQQVAWSGWQALEKTENGQTTERRIYGNGIDELVQLEKIDAGTNLTYAPVYDAKGNLALLTDANGWPVERAETSTYGQTTWYADSTPPAITQLRLRDGAIEIRTDEEVRLAGFQAALAAGKGTLVETATSHEVSTLATQPPSATQGARPLRLLLTLSTAISSETELRLRLEPEAIQDLFGNTLAAPYEQTLTWAPGADTLLADSTAPEVSHVILRGTSLEIGFTEPTVATSVATAILLNGQPRTWTPSGDGQIWTTPDLEDGDHTLVIAVAPLDLAGKPLDETFERTFRIEPSHLGQIVYRKPDPSELPTSATGTALAFQGLELDSETGLLYVRNRYFDPELGRFITADPMGYPDGPSGYAFGGGDSVNGRDPMGLQSAQEAAAIASSLLPIPLSPAILHPRETAEEIRRVLADPYVQGSLQMLGGCSEAVLGAIAAGGTAGAAAIPGLLAVLHGSDTCITGFKAVFYGKNQETVTAESLSKALIYSGIPPAKAVYWSRFIDGMAGAGLTANAARSLLPGARAAVVPTTGANLTNQEILDLGKGPLSRKAAAELRNDVLQDANFAQKTFSQAFSSEGAFAGRTVDDVAAALRSGQMSAADVPIEYIVRDGNTLKLNTRSAQALEAAGIPRAQWNAVNMTGNAAAEARLTRQLQRNGLSSQGMPTVTPGRR